MEEQKKKKMGRPKKVSYHAEDEYKTEKIQETCGYKSNSAEARKRAILVRYRMSRIQTGWRGQAPHIGPTNSVSKSKTLSKGRK